MIENLLNQAQVAKILQVSPKTLEYWRYQGKGPKWVKVGSLPRYREADIAGYIESLKS